MKKIIFYIFLVLFLFSINQIYSQKVSLEEVKEVSKNFYWEESYAANKSLDYSKITPEISYIELRNDKIIYYVVNLPNSNAHVYVSSDKRIKAVLGYGEGLYNEDDLQAPAYIEWMESYSKQIESFLNEIQNGAKYSTINPDWIKYNKQNLSPNNNRSVSALLSTTWNQGCYYNANCPYDASSNYCSRALVGCLATAMAQIMKYHSWPTTGTGSHSYTHSTYGTLSANFGATTYNWSAMPNNVTSSNSSVATLSYHCGVAANMN